MSYQCAKPRRVASACQESAANSRERIGIKQPLVFHRIFVMTIPIVYEILQPPDPRRTRLPYFRRLAVTEKIPNRSWLRPILLSVGLLAALGLVATSVLFIRWTETSVALPAEAQAAFDQALIEAGGGPAYVTISNNGPTVINHELEPSEPAPFNKLILLAWSPRDEKIMRQEYPYWFVRLKLSSSLNLGTMISVLRRDWQQLDLSISLADLKRRGPGLVLDHRRKDGARIMLWAAAR